MGKCCTVVVQEDGTVQEKYCTYKLEDEVIAPKGKLYTEMGVFSTPVYARKCINDNEECSVHYDGQKDGVFNYSGNKAAPAQPNIYPSANC